MPKKIKMLRTTIVGGKAAVAGAVVDAPDRDAAYLIATGSAEAFTAPKKAPAKKTAPANKSVPVEDIETR